MYRSTVKSNKPDIWEEVTLSDVMKLAKQLRKDHPEIEWPECLSMVHQCWGQWKEVKAHQEEERRAAYFVKRKRALKAKVWGAGLTAREGGALAGGNWYEDGEAQKIREERWRKEFERQGGIAA